VKTQPVKKSKQVARLTSPDDLPVKPTLEELGFVRKALHDTASHFVARIDGELNAIREAVAVIDSQKKVPAERMKSLRDLLLILREIEVKPEKGRRRDLKKIEAAVKELRRIVESWE
jgi:hypothetical protein